MMLKQRF